ncbi:hypothetical protein EW146_g4384 [Bondarzewia mesenterica]|uniref:Tetrapyrrole biosynthesis uroporphyrinogen III synthase domain-containing protein n=1 Tax=Bondarzewia mesenterica TaxID=1095465 RepID=A0A4S4LWK8_9AGAM|nr:hypothetical protein EW146_g4384 [Bondarzewia mesenterica]
MANSSIPIYILSDSAELPDGKVDDLVHTFTTTSAVQPVAIITFITTRPTRPLSTPQDLVSYHFETKQPNTPVSPILALDKRSGEDGTVLFAAPVPPRDEVELSDDDEEEDREGAADDNIMHCRVVAEWVNALAANMATGHQSPDLHVKLRLVLPPALPSHASTTLPCQLFLLEHMKHNAMSTPVLLLRAPTTPPEADRYETALRGAGYCPLSIPVLETVLVNIDELIGILKSGPLRAGVGGVIVTSARAAEAWAKAVEGVSCQDDEDEADWTSTPFYTVGPATADSLSSISSSSCPRLCPKDVRGAAESGTAERLGRFILSELGTSVPGMKLLYLTGDKNRETLPGILKKGGVELVGLQVYATQGAQGFSADLEEALRGISEGACVSSVFHHIWANNKLTLLNGEDTVPWVVFFAPSAAAYIVPILRTRFSLPSSPARSNAESGNGRVVERRAMIAAIGPTTSDFLQTLGLTVEAVPAKPTAEELAQALRAVDPQFKTAADLIADRVLR